MSDKFTAYSFADYIIETRKNNPTSKTIYGIHQ